MLAWEGRNDKKVAPEAEIRHIKEGRRGLRKGGEKKRERKKRKTNKKRNKKKGRERKREERNTKTLLLFHK